MKEKYASYYKKLKCFQDPVENPENEGEQNLVKDALNLNKEIAVGENYSKAKRNKRKLMSFGPKIRQRAQSTKSSRIDPKIPDLL